MVEESNTELAVFALIMFAIIWGIVFLVVGWESLKNWAEEQNKNGVELNKNESKTMRIS